MKRPKIKKAFWANLPKGFHHHRIGTKEIGIECFVWKGDPGEVVFANGVRGYWHTGTTAPLIMDDPTVYKHTHVTGYAELGRVCFEEFGHWLIQSPTGNRGGQISSEERNHYNDIAQASLSQAMLDWIDNDKPPIETNLKQSLHQWNTILGLYASAIRRQPVEIPFQPPTDLLARLRTELS